MTDLLSQLRADPLWVDNRRNSIGGSDANVIMGVDLSALMGGYMADDETPDRKLSRYQERLLNLWLEKRRERAPDDLSDKLFVVMGTFTEPLNQAWFEKQTGIAVNRVDVGRTHATTPWRTCTLDGWIGDAAIWEAKHCSPYRRDDEILDAYMPQLHHNMDVCAVRLAYLSVIKGNGDWFMAEVEYDDAYGQAVREAEEVFWASVASGVPPIALPVPKAPRPPGWRDYDMSTSNTWTMHAPLWLECAPKAKQFKDTVEALKGAIPDDAKTCTGHGVKASVDKRGAVRFTALEDQS